MASLGEELLNVVNRLQDLVFNTIGNDSLDLPQIVRLPLVLQRASRPMCCLWPHANWTRSSSDRSRLESHPY
jgi:dynamin 1-like protein